MKTINQIRRNNLLILSKELGGLSALAEKSGKSYNQLHQLIKETSHSVSGKTRGIGDGLARALERICDKEEGWMDHDHEGESELASSRFRLIPIDGTNKTLVVDHSINVNAFTLEIPDDAMADQFSVGDTVIIDPSVKPIPGDFIAATLDNSEKKLFRRFIQPEVGVDELIPLNRYYPSYKSTSVPFQIIGTMIEHRKYRK